MTPGTSDGTDGGIRLLESAIGYALAAAAAVTPDFLSRPTPCRDWDLRMLLRHAGESLCAIHEGIDAGCIARYPSREDAGVASDPARVFRERAGLLRDACASPGRPHEVIHIADALLTRSVMASAGALEIAVHGWDVSRACGHCQPIPRALAAGLLAIAPLLVPCRDRPPLFAEPVSVPPEADPSDRLAAFLGRNP
ncbi:MAG TPA: TIGR03086 family metal-binding protein [Streptosporangiaceae bacterium]|nr:TIGR03086 family metal-binding protein [Streptosporangiaceae bacterium]